MRSSRSSVGVDVRGLAHASRAPDGALAIAAILAIAIGLNTAVYSMVDAVLVRPLPFADVESIVFVWNTPSHLSREPKRCTITTAPPRSVMRSPPQFGQEASTLARERYKPLVPASRTPKPRKTRRQATTRQEILKRALNEPWQALPHRRTKATQLWPIVRITWVFP